MNGRKLGSISDIANFITAGNALFSLKNTKNGNHITYKVTVAENKPDFWFVKVLTGSDNKSDYTYLGTLRKNGAVSGLSLNFTHGVKSPIGKDAKTSVTAAWFFDKLNTKNLPPALEVWHEGKCCRCARTLTVPESIDAGIGPECMKKNS